jgi:putative Holliday junction resolvase
LGRLLGVDYGSRRIGVAVSDALGITTRPLCALDRKRRADWFDALADLVAAEEVVGVIVGLPRHDDGSPGVVAVPATALARRLAAELARRHGASAPPVYMHDESATSSEARERLQAAGGLRRGRDGRPADKGAIDAAAAAVLLERFLQERGHQHQLIPIEPLAEDDDTPVDLESAAMDATDQERTS